MESLEEAPPLQKPMQSRTHEERTQSNRFGAAAHQPVPTETQLRPGRFLEHIVSLRFTIG